MTATTAPTRMTTRQTLLLIVLCGAALLEGADVAMFNVALPVIRADLGLPTTELQWVLSGYVITYGGFMILGGRVADRFGRRRVFLAALTVFIAFSALGGLADGGAPLIAARFATGAAAAFLMPAGLSIVTTAFPEGPARTRAITTYGAIGAAGFSLGLVAGGLLTILGWRWVFFAPVLIGVALLALSIPLLPRDAGGDRERFDALGAAALTAGMVLLVLGIENLAHGSPFVVAAAFAGAAAAAGVFVWRQLRASAPLIPPALVRLPGLARAYAGGAGLAGGFMGFQFLVVLYLQELRGWSALATALAMLVLAIDAIVAPLLTPRLVARFGVRAVAIGGLVAAALSFVLFLPVTDDWTYAAMFPSFLALGLAFAFAYGPLAIAATTGVPEAQQGLTSGILFTTFQFGAAIGLAAASAVQVAVLDAGAPELESYRVALLAPLAFAVAGILAQVLPSRRLRGARRSSAAA